MQFKSFPEYHALDISNNGTGASSLEAKTGNSENTTQGDECGKNGAKIAAQMDWNRIKILELLPYCYEADHPDAWIELHRRLDRRIQQVVRSRLSRRTKATRELVDELVQETWYKILDHDRLVLKKTYPADNAFYKYVLTIAVNAVNDYFRRPEWNIINNSDTVDDPDNPISLFAPKAKDSVHRAEIEKILRREFGSKPHFERDLGIFRLHYWYAYNAAQIAQLCCLSPAKVANILIRMRNTLKRELGGDH